MVSAEAKKFMTPATFGRGTFMGDDPSIQTLSDSDRLYVSAWRHACFQPTAVEATYGIEWTRQRYDECDFVTGLILEHIQKRGPEKQKLYKALTTSKLRDFSQLPSEYIGHHEKDRVPNSQRKERAPLATLVGYSLPRVFIEIAGRGDKRNWTLYKKALDLLDKAIDISDKPEELVARLAEFAAVDGVSRETLLSYVLEPQVLVEQNSNADYRRMIDALKTHSPILWAKYIRMNTEERKKAGILPRTDNLWP